MPLTRMHGPFALEPATLRAMVEPSAPGVYVLGNGESTAFVARLLGRSDIDLRGRLTSHIGLYESFKFFYCGSPVAAFESECGLFHDLDQRWLGSAHPRPPQSSGWKCPRCG
jgi:hypothetical protein